MIEIVLFIAITFGILFIIAGIALIGSSTNSSLRLNLVTSYILGIASIIIGIIILARNVIAYLS